MGHPTTWGTGAHNPKPHEHDLRIEGHALLALELDQVRHQSLAEFRVEGFGFRV